MCRLVYGNAPLVTLFMGDATVIHSMWALMMHHPVVLYSTKDLVVHILRYDVIFRKPKRMYLHIQI